MDKYKSKQFDITKQDETKKINIETVFNINESNGGTTLLTPPFL